MKLQIEFEWIDFLFTMLDGIEQKDEEKYKKYKFIKKQIEQQILAYNEATRTVIGNGVVILDKNNKYMSPH